MCRCCVVAMRVGGRRDCPRPVKLACPGPLFVPLSPILPSSVVLPNHEDGCANFAEALSQECRAGIVGNVCLWVPKPVLELIKRHSWSSLLLRRAWFAFDNNNYVFHKALVPKPDARWLGAAAAPSCARQDPDCDTRLFGVDPGASVSLTSRDARRLANFVRNASAGHLQSLADEEAVAHETLWLQRGVQALDNFARCSEAGSVHKLQDKENVMAEAHRQVCLILAARAFRRKDANNLTRVWKQLVHGTLPSVLTRIAIESFVKLPSARWFCYRQTSVCAALSLTMQTILKEDPEDVYYFYTDPSAQHRTNWSPTVLERVPGGRLLELFSLAKWLASSADRFGELTQQSAPRDIDAIPDDVNIDTRMALVRERCRAGKAIQGFIHAHRLPPQSVSNAEDVRGKVKAVCAAVQLQAHASGLGRDIFGRVRSVTVDRGVEYKLCTILGTLEHYP